MIDIIFHDKTGVTPYNPGQTGGFENAAGSGEIHYYRLFDGVGIMLLRLEMETYTEIRTQIGMIEINFCINGRFETSFSMRDSVLLKPGDMAVSCYDGRHPEKCAIAAPSFSGYERAVKAYGAGIVYYELDSNNGFSYEYVSGRLEQLDVQLCFICNPNNPTGNIIPENILINILDICRRRNIIVVADECFLRFNRNYEKISCKRFLKDYNNLVIINAYTKFYAMAGIRLGYLMSYNDELIDNISLQLPEWNISTVAQRAGIAAFKDKDYEGHTYRLIEKEREFLTDKLSAMECIVYPSVADYITFRLPSDKAGCQLQDELLKNGILIRSCQSYRNMLPDCYRIAVTKH